MTTAFDFDLFVIGGGSGGVRAARMAAQRGARVALAETLGTDVVVFQAGTKLDGPTLLTNGGRVLCVTAMGDSLDAARREVYEATKRVRFDGGFYRTDIGKRPVTLTSGT